MVLPRGRCHGRAGVAFERQGHLLRSLATKQRETAFSRRVFPEDADSGTSSAARFEYPRPFLSLRVKQELPMLTGARGEEGGGANTSKNPHPSGVGIRVFPTVAKARRPRAVRPGNTALKRGIYAS